MGVPPAVERVLSAYRLSGPRVEPIPVGLIHESFDVRDGAAAYVLQRVSPIFSPGIHENIRAVTEHLHARGVLTFRIVPTAGGSLTVDLGADGSWRLLTRVPGVCFETCSSAEQARAAGGLVARFHSALADLDHAFRPLGILWHDTPAHLRQLEEAVGGHRDHPLHGDVAALAERILAAARDADPLEGVPDRVVHMDLKFNNVLFAGESGTACKEAVSLIDLDTVCRLPLYMELGDAWRSWCNRRGEDSPEAELDMEIFRASAEGYLGSLELALGREERASLAHGLERLSLELAARFAADALVEGYFGWDPERFASRGEHNLVRARGQLSLFEQARAARGELARLLAG